MSDYNWLPYAAGYMFAVGVLGIAAKLALKGATWPAILLATTACYLVLTAVVLLKGGVTVPKMPVSGWLALVMTGVLTAGSFPLLISALSRGDASVVVPVTAAYPVLTAILSVLVLSEPFSWLRLCGTVLIVAGVALVSAQVPRG